MAGETQTTSPVTFDYTWWQFRYPELAEWCSPGMAQGYFEVATGYLDNTDASPVRDIRRRQILLGMLTSHIAALNAPVNGQQSPTGVGRVSAATQGSVSVTFDYPETAGAEWFTQTKYGAAFWQATARYRRARYHPGPQRFSQDRPGSFGIRRPF